MKLEQPIITLGADGRTLVIVHRLMLDCELVENLDSFWARVRILQAGGGLSVGDVVRVPRSKLTAS